MGSSPHWGINQIYGRVGIKEMHLERDGYGSVMACTIEIQEKANLIIEAVKQEKGINPIQMFKRLAQNQFVSIHGPEHHVLDGACLLKAYANAGGKIDVDEALDKLMQEGLRMPGAACGLWGVCGAVTSMGAALAIIDGTGPLSSDGTWGEHMKFTSKALGDLAKINGPRCCKRDAFVAFENAIDYVNSHYDVTLEKSEITCEFSNKNQQCIGDRCPYHVEKT